MESMVEHYDDYYDRIVEKSADVEHFLKIHRELFEAKGNWGYVHDLECMFELMQETVARIVRDSHG